MSMGEAIAPFVGRVILAWFFLAEAYTRTVDWDATVNLLNTLGVPFAPITHFVTLTVMVLASVSLIIGLRARVGALALFSFVAVSNIFMNDYWNIADVIERREAATAFARNLALGGGLLVLMGLGPGRFAMED